MQRFTTNVKYEYNPLFFQAEDGIRFRNVTGVQTCALPISITFSKYSLKTVLPDRVRPSIESIGVSIAFQIKFLRSEERRVGKEDRCRCKPAQEKKNMKQLHEKRTETNRRDDSTNITDSESL